MGTKSMAAWFTTIRIVDSSVVRSANDLLLPKPGVAINLFANFRDWLPEVESGQAVVLRRLMVRIAHMILIQWLICMHVGR